METFNRLKKTIERLGEACKPYSPVPMPESLKKGVFELEKEEAL